MPRILIADDAPDVLEALRLMLKGEGYETGSARSPADVMKRIAREAFDFAFDEEERSRLINRAGEHLLAETGERLTGRTAIESGLAERPSDANDAGNVRRANDNEIV